MAGYCGKYRRWVLTTMRQPVSAATSAISSASSGHRVSGFSTMTALTPASAAARMPARRKSGCVTMCSTSGLSALSMACRSP
jgi:hypothetical protein